MPRVGVPLSGMAALLPCRTVRQRVGAARCTSWRDARAVSAPVRRLGLALALGGLSLGLVGQRSSTDAANASPIPPAAFLRLAEAGIHGTFEATYRVVGNPGAEGPNANGTVVVAQRAGAHTSAWPDGAGEWSYRLESVNGWGFQWIEHGLTAEDCWRTPTERAWRCTGPGTYEGSNGFVISTWAFVPATAVAAISNGIGPSAVSLHLQTYREARSANGPLVCLRRASSSGNESWCLTTAGRLASEKGVGAVFFDWPLITLTHCQEAVPSPDFVPLGKVKPPFGLPPE